MAFLRCKETGAPRRAPVSFSDESRRKSRIFTIVALLLRDIALLLAVALAVVVLFARLRLPSLVGFLAAGLLIGPNALGLIRDPEQVRLLAEIGLILLLFAVGLEFSFAQLRRMAREVFWGGGLQVLLTTLGTAAGAWGLGLPLAQALFWGILLAMSSTAIVFRLLSDEGLLGTPYGRLSVGILLFQDLLLVPIMVLIPLLGVGVETMSAPSATEVGLTILKALALLGLILFGARVLIPRLLQLLARTGSRELFLLGLVALCIGAAWLTAAAGLSLALGAFVAGVVISESEYSYQAIAEVLPLRDSLSAFFFISIGMLLDPQTVWLFPAQVLGLSVGIVALKTLMVTLAARLMGYTWRVGALAGVSLAQIGEFSFVIAAVGRDFGLIEPASEQRFLAAAVLSLLATPALVLYGPRWMWTGMRRASDAAQRQPEAPAFAELQGHVIVAGFGASGQMLGRVFQEAQVPFCVIDFTRPAEREAELAGIPFLFGDATRPEVLEAAGLARARLLILTIGDPIATRVAVRLARTLRPDVAILVRTRFVSEIEELYRLGATQVVAEELEATLTLFTRALEYYHIPRHLIAAQAAVARSSGYELLRLGRLSARTLMRLPELLAAGTVETVRLPPNSPAVGRSLRQLELRQKTGASIIGVVRGHMPYPNPDPEFVLHADDLLIVFGNHREVDQALAWLVPSREEPIPEANPGPVSPSGQRLR